jgi:hydroxylamine reductase (hybrid-cluster protein)
MKGSIYAIRSHQTPNIYIGSTIQILCKRMSQHRKEYKYYNNGKNNYCYSFKILQYEDAYIELIEIVEFIEKTELFACEGHYIRTMECINKSIMGRTKKECDNHYYIKNKEKIDNKNKQYSIDNEETIKEYKKQYRIDNKEKLNQYRIDNREKINEKQREQRKQKKLLEQIIIE